MACPLCAQTITIGFLECPVFVTRCYCTKEGPTPANMFANPEGRRQADVARYAYYGFNRLDRGVGVRQ